MADGGTRLHRRAPANIDAVQGMLRGIIAKYGLLSIDRIDWGLTSWTQAELALMLKIRLPDISRISKEFSEI